MLQKSTKINFLSTYAKMFQKLHNLHLYIWFFYLLQQFCLQLFMSHFTYCVCVFMQFANVLYAPNKTCYVANYKSSWTHADLVINLNFAYSLSRVLWPKLYYVWLFLLHSNAVINVAGTKLDGKAKSSQWEGRDDGAAEQIVLKRVRYFKANTASDAIALKLPC